MGYPSPAVDVRTGAGEPLLKADVGPAVTAGVTGAVVVAVVVVGVVLAVVLKRDGMDRQRHLRNAITLPWPPSSPPLPPAYSDLHSRRACASPHTLSADRINAACDDARNTLQPGTHLLDLLWTELSLARELAELAHVLGEQLGDPFAWHGVAILRFEGVPEGGDDVGRVLRRWRRWRFGRV